MVNRTIRVPAGILASLVVLTIVVGVRPVEAAPKCSSPGHRPPVLSNGTVAPGTGTTSTAFTFSVVYRDAAGCAPSSVVVIITGLGSAPLQGTGNYVTGVTFSASGTLPAGTYTYAFRATSGTGSGIQTVMLTTVSPASVVVTAPPTPTPKPTAKPTPKPTTRPTAKPTTKPTAKPKPAAKPSPAPTQAPGTAAAPASASPASSPSPDGAGPLIGFLPDPPGPPAPGSGGSPLGGSGPGPPWFVYASLTALIAASGLGIFFLLVRPRRRSDEEGALAEAAVAGGGAALQQLPPDTPFEEASMPRWRRPSLRAARQSSSRDPERPHVPQVFRSAPDEGAVLATVRYRLVRLGTEPDEFRGDEIGRLDRGDEVELVRIEGAYGYVRTPDGTEGWIHRMTLDTDVAGGEGMATAPAPGDA